MRFRFARSRSRRDRARQVELASSRLALTRRLIDLTGHTRNPYALDRVRGIGGGTAAAIASNFGAIGLGMTPETPFGAASHQALVGSDRRWADESSRRCALNLLADIAGPITRTVQDTVAVFQVVAVKTGRPVTTASRAHAIPTYARSLVRDGLKGARIGVLRQAYERSTTDPEACRFYEALQDMKKAGAEIVDRHP